MTRSLIPSVLLLLSFGGAAAAQDARPTVPPATASTVQPAAQPPADGTFAARLARFVEFQAGSVGTRYRFIDPSTAARDVSEVQTNAIVRARFRVDPQGRVGVVVAATTGSGFIGSWDPTGIGTTDRDLAFQVRHLYADVLPVKWMTLQAGSLPFVRGETTEITSYDNDGYLAGERVAVRRRDRLFFDEIAFSTGYLGDTAKADVFDRASRFDENNYSQILVARRVTDRVGVSVDYTDAMDRRTLRGGVRVRVAAPLVDALRYEQYVRFDDEGAGFAVQADKAWPRKAALAFGFAHIDRGFTPLNGDKYLRGSRVFANVEVPIVGGLTAATFVTHAFTDDYGLPNKTRMDVTLAWNVLADLRRAHVVK